MRQSRADVVEKWTHDLFRDSEQGPRAQWEKDRVREGGERERWRGGGGKSCYR